MLLRKTIHVARVACLLLAVSTSLGADTATGKLVVVAEGLLSNNGALRFSLFDSEKSFLKRPLMVGIVEIENRRGTWVIDELAHGVYAVLVHHDVDGSGKMERHWYGKPREPTGASNNPPPRMGPPKFEDTNFSLESAEKRLLVSIK